MLQKAKTLQSSLTALRREIHENPELSFAEFETAALVSKTLTELGIQHRTEVGGTGVVATLGKASTNGRRIGIRADMDALPIVEARDVPYRSKVPGKMHACGHDAHTATLLGVAMLLAEEDIDGEIRLLFQPAEEAADAEGISGAPRMIDAGAVEGLDAVIALHTDSRLDSGKIAITPGYALANVDTVYAKINGVGGHGAMPHAAIDPIFIMGPVLSALHGIVSRRCDPTSPAVVTVGRITGGTTSNVIPDTVELDLTLRSLDDGTRELLLTEVENALAIAKNLGGDYSLEIERGYPALFNDAEVCRWVEDTAGQLIGKENVCAGELIMGAEDFAYMIRESRGMMLWLGTKEPSGPARYHHHPEFDVDESAMPIGAAILAETARRYVQRELG